MLEAGLLHSYPIYSHPHPIEPVSYRPGWHMFSCFLHLLQDKNEPQGHSMALSRDVHYPPRSITVCEGCQFSIPLRSRHTGGSISPSPPPSLTDLFYAWVVAAYAPPDVSPALTTCPTPAVCIRARHRRLVGPRQLFLAPCYRDTEHSDTGDEKRGRPYHPRSGGGCSGRKAEVIGSCRKKGRRATNRVDGD